MKIEAATLSHVLGLLAAIGRAASIAEAERIPVWVERRRPAKNRMRSQMDSYSFKLVTLGGEYLEFQFERQETAPDRDGVFYLFKLNDLVKNWRSFSLCQCKELEARG